MADDGRRLSGASGSSSSRARAGASQQSSVMLVYFGSLVLLVELNDNADIRRFL